MTEPVHDLVGAYALDAVGPEEARLFEAHLERCPSCAAELAELRATAAALAAAAAEPPPARLREAVFAEIDAVRQESPLLGARRARRRAAAVVAALAAAAVLVAAIAGGAALQRRADRAERIAEVAAAPDALTVGLAPADAGSAALRVVWSAAEGEAVLVGRRLPPPGEDRVYVLWYIDPTRGARPAASFSPDGTGSITKVIDADLAGVEQLGVTVEPAGAPPAAPTLPVRYAGPV